MELILASKSPRRVELLKQLRQNFKVLPSNVNEQIAGDFTPEQLAVELAERKAKAVFLRYPKCGILAADTLVVLDGKILGKPKNTLHATEMLKSLSGKTHSVITGVCFMHRSEVNKGFEKTQVTFNELTAEQINKYVKSGLPLDKAGSYGIQDGHNLVKGYAGSYTNIVGLPLELVKDMLAEDGGKRKDKR